MSETESKDFNDAKDTPASAFQVKRKIKISFKKPACKFTNRPKEIILIRGRDPACKQMLTFHQQTAVSRAAHVLHAPRHACDSIEWDTCILPERPRTLAAIKAERSRELVAEDEESGRDWKKPRRTLEEFE